MEKSKYWLCVLYILTILVYRLYFYLIAWAIDLILNLYISDIVSTKASIVILVLIVKSYNISLNSINKKSFKLSKNLKRKTKRFVNNF